MMIVGVGMVVMMPMLVVVGVIVVALDPGLALTASAYRTHGVPSVFSGSSLAPLPESWRRSGTMADDATGKRYPIRRRFIEAIRPMRCGTCTALDHGHLCAGSSA
jgi:hypothetical protein